MENKCAFNFTLPNFGLRNFKLPNVGILKFGIPQFGIPQFGLPQFKLLKFNLNKFKLTNFIIIHSKLSPFNRTNFKPSNVTRTTRQALFFVLTLLLPFKHLYADGNHTWAKSEAWTWMGHLRVIDPQSTPWTFESKGYAYIHYFTRNETGYGRMNFKSSAVTETKDDTGIGYDKRTIFPDESPSQNFQLRVRDDVLAIEFLSGTERDLVYEEPLLPTDEKLLEENLLPLFPGLGATIQGTIKKYRFSAHLGRHSRADLTFYSLWPDLAPPNQQMEFFGLKDSYTFSSPMLMTYGTWSRNNEKPETVVGLSFLDRQWSREYFGKNIFNNPIEMLRPHQALKWAHNWSAFHAFAPATNDWYFVHLWQQSQREPEKEDRRSSYTGVQWSKNGKVQTMIDSSEFQWTPRKFIKNNSKVLLNFAEGRKAFFPFQYEYESLDGRSHFNMIASPQLQSLDQPIYLYEGYAAGEGFWDNQMVQLQGRVESSQILFRDVDYRSIIENIDKSDQEQTNIYESLQGELEKTSPLQEVCSPPINHTRYLFNDLPRKQKIFKSQFIKKPKSPANHWITYF